MSITVQGTIVHTSIEEMSPTALHESQYCINEDRNLPANVLSGLLVHKLHETDCKLYICGRKTFEEVSNYVPLKSVVVFGPASSYLYIGQKCFVVWELLNPQNAMRCKASASGSTGDKMWFAVTKCAAPFTDALVRDRLNYHVQDEWFQRGGVTDNASCEEPVVIHNSKILVGLITAHPGEFQSTFLRDPSYSHNLWNNIREAVDASDDIHINLKGIGDKEGAKDLNRSITNLLYSFCQTETKVDEHNNAASSGASCVLGAQDEPTDRNTNFNDGSASSATTIHSIVQVDDNALDEISKIKLESEYDQTEANANICLSSESYSYSNDNRKQLKREDPPPKAKPKIYIERRLLLDCPMCGMTFRSCKNRFQRLVSHIKRRHSERQNHLLKFVHQKYFCKGCLDCTM